MPRELAEPATEIQLSNFRLLEEQGVALKLPVKVHLENPFLGSSCYVGSSSNPIIWNLTTGTTEPPAGHATHGLLGFVELQDGLEIVEVSENKLVGQHVGSARSHRLRWCAVSARRPAHRPDDGSTRRGWHEQRHP